MKVQDFFSKQLSKALFRHKKGKIYPYLITLVATEFEYFLYNFRIIERNTHTHTQLNLTSK